MNPKLTAASLRDLAGKADKAAEISGACSLRVATAPQIDEPARLALNDLTETLQEMAKTARHIAKRLDGRNS